MRKKQKSRTASTPLQRLLRRIRSAEQCKVNKANAAIRVANDLPLGHPVNTHKIDSSFQPVEQVLDTLVATGDIDVDTKGEPIFYSPQDDDYYPLVPGLLGLSDTFSKLAEEFGWTDQTAGMRLFAKKLDEQIPILQADIDAARASLGWMRENIRSVTPAQFSDEAIVVQIRAELEQQAG